MQNERESLASPVAPEDGIAKFRRFLLGGMVLALFFPALAIATVGGSGIQVYIIFLVLACALGALELVQGKLSFQLKRSHWLLLALLIVATVLISRASAAPMGGWAINPLTKTLRQLVFLYSGVAVYISVTYLLRTENDLRLAVTMLFVGGWFALIYSIGETLDFFHLTPWFDWVDHVIRNNPSFDLSITEHLFGLVPRLHSFAPEQSDLTLLLALPLSLALSALLVAHGTRSKSYYLLACGLGLVYIISFSRLAIVGLLITFLVIVLLVVKSRYASLLRFAPLLLGVFMVSAVALGASSTGRPENLLSYGTDQSIYTRVVTQIIALDVWSKNILGVGWGLFGYYFQTRVTPYLLPNATELHTFVFSNSRAWVPIHDVYLRFATELGIEGLALFGILVGIIGVKSFRAAQASLKKPSSFVPVATLATFAAILVTGLMADFTVFGMFWFLLAFVERVADVTLANRQQAVPSG